MIQALYSGVSGLVNQQTRLDTIGNNIANVNTVGYKAVRLDFKDAIYQSIRSPVQPQDERNLEMGHGVSTAATTQLVTQGYVEDTGRDLDFMLTGPGYFAVEMPSGETQYTRAGNFYLSVEGDGTYLVSAEGYYVQDEAGARIAVPADAATLTSDARGTIYAGDAPVARLAVYGFENAEGLERQGGNRFRQSANSGAPVAMDDAAVKQGSLEMANVDMGQEMTLMIRAQRAFQFAGDVVRTADTLWSTVNSMRR